MAPSTGRTRVKRPVRDVPISRKLTLQYMFNDLKKLLTNPEYSWIVSSFLLILEIFITSLVIYKIPYTEIDWRAYMQEVEGVLNGNFDYNDLKGDTGPLVYPAGFVYVYMIFYAITGKGSNVLTAQILFAVLYLITLYFVFQLYSKSKAVQPYALIFMCCTSYRIHSIYVLRLFNDPVAILFFFIAVNCFVKNKWLLGSVLYSVAVSIKMNILLFAPGLFFVLLHSTGILKTFSYIFVCAFVQLVVGLPFLIVNPVSYVSNAFDLGRIFLHQWTVNWRFVPEEIFINRYFHITLLALHLVSLVMLAYKWKKNFGLGVITGGKEASSLTLDNILFVLFTSNFVGVAFSRSLHYQFYVWYFFTLPHILWTTKFNPVLKLCVLGVLELCWNTYPSTYLSSGALHFCHILTLIGISLCDPRGKVFKLL